MYIIESSDEKGWEILNGNANNPVRDRSYNTKTRRILSSKDNSDHTCD